MPVAIIVDWVGPFDNFNEFRKQVRENWGSVNKCVYMAIGAHNVINYIGLTKNPTGRFYNHPKMCDESNRRFFIGEIVSQGVSGRRRQATRPDLNIAEHALIAALQPRLNSRRLSSSISDCVSVFSRFFSPNDYETVIHPLPKFPSVIAFNSYSGDLRLHY